MSDKIGLFAGSFDPVTNGHLDLIQRASRFFDRLYIGIFYNHEKSGLFPVEMRQNMVEEAVADLPNVVVLTAANCLTVDIAKQLGVTQLIRGLRNAQDFDYEANMAYFNRHLAQEIETLFLLTAPEWHHLSSSRVRELIQFKADIAPFVPHSVLKEVEKMLETNKTL